MRIKVSGKQIEIGDALRQHVEGMIGDISSKYAERPTDAVATFSRNAGEFTCETTIHLSTGLNSSAKATAHEIYAAFDKCAERLEKQLRRYKRRLKNHHNQRRTPVETFGAPSYILAPSHDDSDEAEPETLQPVIVAEMETQIPALSVGEAVMQMELVGAPVLVFRNEGHKGVNVVYKRDDGNIGWIDPN